MRSDASRGRARVSSRGITTAIGVLGYLATPVVSPTSALVSRYTLVGVYLAWRTVTLLVLDVAVERESTLGARRNGLWL
jgi:hypothetical protein